MSCAGFDLEISKYVAFEEGGDLFDHSPLGVSCAALSVQTATAEDWAVTYQGLAGNSMSPERIDRMVVDLERRIPEGCPVVTWNGLGFDFRVLWEEAREPSVRKRIAELAMRHVDLAFLMHCQLGYMASLDGMAKGLGLAGKTEGMSGDLAPILWTGWPALSAGEGPEALAEDLWARVEATGLEPGTPQARTAILGYVLQDARATAEIYCTLLAKGQTRWINSRGVRSGAVWTPATRLDARRKHDRFLTCAEALSLPLPDTAWMQRQPRARESFYAWAG